jgi:hypothetical protein
MNTLFNPKIPDHQHSNKIPDMICLDESCPNKFKALCSLCLKEHHKHYILSINGLLSEIVGSFSAGSIVDLESI